LSHFSSCDFAAVISEFLLKLEQLSVRVGILLQFLFLYINELDALVWKKRPKSLLIAVHDLLLEAQAISSEINVESRRLRNSAVVVRGTWQAFKAKRWGVFFEKVVNAVVAVAVFISVVADCCR
jgi:hypothetical protein